MKDQQKSELLKGLLKSVLECLPKEGKSKEGLSGQAYTTSMRDCSIRNHLLSETRTALKGWVERLELDEEIVANIIQLRYFKLMQPDITESDAEIVAGSLAKALAKEGMGLVRVKK